MIKLFTESTDRRKEFLDYFAKHKYRTYHAVHRIIKHLMLEYDRYHEANILLEHLEKLNLGRKILDFGCGVSDYGIAFGANGYEVSMADVPIILNFAIWRYKVHFGKEPTGLKCSYDVKLDLSNHDFDIILAAESLDHITHPFRTLKEFYNHSKCFVTTAYPFEVREKDHTASIREANACKEFLQKRYKTNIIPDIKSKRKFWICRKRGIK